MGGTTAAGPLRSVERWGWLLPSSSVMIRLADEMASVSASARRLVESAILRRRVPGARVVELERLLLALAQVLEGWSSCIGP